MTAIKTRKLFGEIINQALNDYEIIIEPETEIPVETEKIMNELGWYKLPRYFVYRVGEDGRESKFGRFGSTTIYNHFGMLEFTALLDHINANPLNKKIKYRVERIEIS